MTCVFTCEWLTTWMTRFILRVNTPDNSLHFSRWLYIVYFLHWVIRVFSVVRFAVIAVSFCSQYVFWDTHTHLHSSPIIVWKPQTNPPLSLHNQPPVCLTQRRQAFTTLNYVYVVFPFRSNITVYAWKMFPVLCLFLPKCCWSLSWWGWFFL